MTTLREQWELARVAQWQAHRLFLLAESQGDSPEELARLKALWEQAKLERRKAFRAYMESE